MGVWINLILHSCNFFINVKTNLFPRVGEVKIESQHYILTYVLTYEFVGSSPGYGVSAPQSMGVRWRRQAKSRQTKVGLAPGEVPQRWLQLGSFQVLGVSHWEMLVPKGQFKFPSHWERPSGWPEGASGLSYYYSTEATYVTFPCFLSSASTCNLYVTGWCACVDLAPATEPQGSMER